MGLNRISQYGRVFPNYGAPTNTFGAAKTMRAGIRFIIICLFVSNRGFFIEFRIYGLHLAAIAVFSGALFTHFFGRSFADVDWTLMMINDQRRACFERLLIAYVLGVSRPLRVSLL